MPTVSTGMFKWLFHRGATIEDFADRLNHFWTVGLLLLFAAIISWRQTYISPIYCWTPAHFTHVWSVFVNDRCWNRYFVVYPDDKEAAIEQISEIFNYSESNHFPLYGKIPVYAIQDKPDIESSSLLTKMSTTRTLYQWLPLILCFQALMFKLPNLLMYILHGLSGISFDKISGLTVGYENLSLQERSTLCRHIGRYIYQWCQQWENCLPWRQLTLLWLFIKCLYCINVIVQLSLINGILVPVNTTSFGDVIIQNLFYNNATLWNEARVFPKEILCDFSIRQLGNIHRYTVQCDIPANYFSEFVYMFIWVWFVFVSVVTCTSLVVWLMKTLIPVSRKRYITKALILANDVDVNVLPTCVIGTFCDVIGEDGVMALKLTASNSSDIMVSEIISSMWQCISTRTVTPGSGEIMTVPTVHVQPSAPGPIYPSLQRNEQQHMEKHVE